MNIFTRLMKSRLLLVSKPAYLQVEETPQLNMTRILLNPQNILIMPYNRMGTVLLATRVFKSFRESYPSAKISVATYEPWSVLISKDPVIDQVIAFGDDIEHPSSKGFQEIGRTLAEQKFDLAFYLSYQFDPVMAYLLRLSRADLRIAFRTSSDVPYFNVEITPASGIRYEVERYLELLRTLGIPCSVRDYTLKISDSTREKAKLRFIPGFSSPDQKMLIGFDLTREIAGDPISKKSAENLIQALISGFDATVAVVFEPAKGSLASELKETFGKRLLVIEDRPISLVAGILSFCRFIVSRNTDLFQLAVALKLPTVGLLTPAEKIQWSPDGLNTVAHLERSHDSWPSGDKLVSAAGTFMKENV